MLLPQPNGCAEGTTHDSDAPAYRLPYYEYYTGRSTPVVCSEGVPCTFRFNVVEEDLCEVIRRMDTWVQDVVKPAVL